ncbi:MAG: intein-containing RctB family protein [Candidatus Omnitrophota bacterium]
MKQAWEGPLEKIDEYRWRIPKSYKKGMRVDGLVYADEKLLKDIRQDNALEQVANVAFLPGIQRYSIGMPDIHWGYGFCIGGVCATDPEEGGVISPGGVGYDINCLDATSNILSSYGFHKKISEMETSWGEAMLKCQDFGNGRETSASVIRYFRLEASKPVYRLVTQGGDQIIATADHPFWTPDGMISLERLNVNDQVALYPFMGVSYETPSEEVIVRESDIRRLFEVLGKDSSGNALNQTLSHLRSLKLLPLRYDSPQLPVLLKILGYQFGDGTLYFTNQRGKGVAWFYGKPDDLEEIRRDIQSIGFTPSKIYRRKRFHKIQTFYNHYEFTTEETCFKVCGSGFVLLLVALGAPLGNKATQDYNVPAWIFNAPLWQKRLFLAAFFGAELTKPKALKERNNNFYMPILSMNKREGFVESGKRFLSEVAKLLCPFGVKMQTISIRRENRNKDGIISYRLRLILSGKSESLRNLWGKVGFEYNQTRRTLANAAVQYLKLKERSVETRKEVIAGIMRMQHAGARRQEIFNLFSPLINQRFIERTLYEERKTDPRVGQDFSTFDQYLKEALVGSGTSGMVWDRVIVIEVVESPKYVYDFTVDHLDHNFIANGFVVSNCGVRLLRTRLMKEEVLPKLRELVAQFFRDVPCGLGREGAIRFSQAEERKILVEGSQYVIKKGFGRPEDVECTEARGRLEGADPDLVSERAYERGKSQVGTLGSGNHFLEVQLVDEIYDPGLAQFFGLQKDQVTIMIHSGSRGLGYQICEDYLHQMEGCPEKYKISLPDRQLVCAPVRSKEGEAYLSAMRAAANYAWANRQVLTHLARQALVHAFRRGEEQLGLDLIYDVAHNIAKTETYEIEGKKKALCIHRKGATRAFPPGHPEISERYRSVGQPVLIPGDMGRNSYLLVGQEGSVRETFGSSCHGAGRVMSRTQAIRISKGRSIHKELEAKGIVAMARGRTGLEEEQPDAYKDVNEVVRVVDKAGISKRVVRFRPIGVIKG